MIAEIEPRCQDPEALVITRNSPAAASGLEAFLAERLTGFGASDTQHLYNLPPYGCARSLVYKKLQTPPDYPLNDQHGPLRRGHRLEALVAEEYAIATGRLVQHAPPMFRHPEYQWAIAHLDGLVAEPGPDPVFDRVLEIKVLGRESYYKALKEGVLDAYVLQVQDALFVTGLQKGAFCVFSPELWKPPIHWDVERDDAIIDDIRGAGSALWEMVQRRELPDRLPARSAQCKKCQFRTTCQGEALTQIANAAEKDAATDVPMDESLADLVEQYVEAKEVADEAAELLDARKDALREAIGERTAIDVPGFRTYFRPQSRATLDGKKLMVGYCELQKVIATLLRVIQAHEAEHLITDEQMRLLGATEADFRNTTWSRPLRIYAR